MGLNVAPIVDPTVPAVPAGTVPAASEPAVAQLSEQRGSENFPVALRVLPSALRRDLVAIYNVVRVIDELGDSAAGDRAAQLASFEEELKRTFVGGAPRSAVLAQLQPTIEARAITAAPFHRLVQANLMDQERTSYRDFAQLREYCMLSAAPVGELVLEVFGVATEHRRELSDRVCIALQLFEHWQDIAEDRHAGRIYLPQEDLDAFEVQPIDLDLDYTPRTVRRLVQFQTERAQDLLESGAPLLGELTGWARLAVTGYVAGGRAAAQALQRSDFDVLSLTPKAAKRTVFVQLLKGLRASGRRSSRGTTAVAS